MAGVSNDSRPVMMRLVEEVEVVVCRDGVSVAADDGGWSDQVRFIAAINASHGGVKKRRGA